MRAVKTYADSEDENDSPQQTSHHNPLLAAHLGLGSDVVEGPLALLARSEVHSEDNDRFKNILAKAKHKETDRNDTQKTKAAPKTSKRTTVKKAVDPSEKKAAKAPAKSRAKPKTKAAAIQQAQLAEQNASTSEAQDATAEDVAPITSATLQAWKRTKSTARSTSENASKKYTAAKNAADESATNPAINRHAARNMDDMEDPELNQNMDDLMKLTATRAKSKLGAFMLGSTPNQDMSKNDAPISVEAHGEPHIPSARWTAQNDELPSSIYQEEDLFDQGFFPSEIPEGDVPDPDYGTFLNFDASQEKDGKSIGVVIPSVTQVLPDSSDDMQVGLQEEDFDALDLEPFSDMTSNVPPLVNHDDMVDLMHGDLDDGALQDLVEDLDGLDDAVASVIDTEIQDALPAAEGAIESKGAVDEDVVMSDFDFEEDEEWNMNLDLSDGLPTTTTAASSDPTKKPPTIAVPQSAAPSSPVHTPRPGSSYSVIVLDSSRPTTPPSEPALTSTFTIPTDPTTLPFLTPVPPIARSPFPPPCLDRSPIVGLTPSTLLRTCFRVGEAMRVGMGACRENRVVIIELYARVLWSVRDTEKGVQTFEFGDLFHGRRPWLRGVYEGWAGKEPWGYDAGLLVTGAEEREVEGEKKMARVLGRVERDERTKGWRLRVMNTWQCEWEDVEVVRGIYG